MGSAASLNAAILSASDSSLREACAGISKEHAAKLLAALDESGEQLGAIDVIVTLLSGKELPCLRADASWTGLQVKSALAKHIDKESLIKELRTTEQVLGDGQILMDLSPAVGQSLKLQAILDRRPEHDLWLQFQRSSGKYLHRILIADAAEAASNTIRLIRDMEADAERCDEDSENGVCDYSSIILGKQLGRVQLMPMVQGQHDSAHTDVSLIVCACQSHNIDAVIVGSGTLEDVDKQLVHNLKRQLGEAGLQVLVFGPSTSAEKPVTEPSGGWNELCTMPPVGARVSDCSCDNCQRRLQSATARCDGEMGEYLSCHINQDGHPCSSWLHCTLCGGAVDVPGPIPGQWSLIRTDRRYVFRSSNPEAGDAKFAMLVYEDGEAAVMQPAIQTDGEWSVDEDYPDFQRHNHFRAECYEEFSSYMERLVVLYVEETSKIGPAEQITFKMIGYRRLSELETAERARLKNETDEEFIKAWCSAELVDIKTGKWMGASYGIEWDDGEIWHCLGLLKNYPLEE